MILPIILFYIGIGFLTSAFQWKYFDVQRCERDVAIGASILWPIFWIVIIIMCVQTVINEEN